MKTLSLTLLLILGLARSWAAEVHPIVEVQTGYLVGAYSGGKWLVSEKAAPSVKAGTSYRLFHLTGEAGKAKGGKPQEAGDPCPEVRMVELTPKSEKGVIAVNVPWNPLPRVPQLAATSQPIYQRAVQEFLQGRGIKNPKVKITKIVRIDLDGDGEEEVLVSATNYSETDGGVPSDASPGSYSFVMLRRVVEGKVKTQLIAGEFYPKAKNSTAPSKYEIGAVLDLDGDGKLEVILQAGYYEGGWTTIYRCTPAKVEELLTVSCGA
jgi:hypothetical protein